MPSFGTLHVGKRNGFLIYSVIVEDNYDFSNIVQ